MSLSAEQQKEMFAQMLKIRHFEERIVEVYTQGLMPGLAHLYIGEEAVAVGACAALNKDDYITSTHRGHGHLIAKGGDLKIMMAEILGKKTGYCKGKGGSMHIADFDLGILGANGIVGGGFTIAVGAALSAKKRKSGQVVICFFGDGASNQGSFHESLNLASIWDLPVVFVCENNLYGISVPQWKHQKIRDVADRAVAYGIPGKIVEGNDVYAVYESVVEAVKRARSGEGPTLLECKTYRWLGHHVGDPNNGLTYRTKEEMDQWREKCPIKRMRLQLIQKGILSGEEADVIDARIVQMVGEAVTFAKESPYPDPAELMDDIYAN